MSAPRFHLDQPLAAGARFSLPPGPARHAARALRLAAGDAVTLRGGVGDGPGLRLLRVAYLPPEAVLVGGAMCCSPTRGGLVVRFDPIRIGPPDGELHEA